MGVFLLVLQSTLQVTTYDHLFGAAIRRPICGEIYYGANQQQTRAHTMTSIQHANRIELVVFLMVSLASSMEATSLWHFVSTLPACYSVAYSISRAFMAFATQISFETTFRVHRFAGVVSLPYSILVWYKLLYTMKVGTTSPAWITSIDAFARPCAWLCTCFNICSGIMLLPHVNFKTPLLLRQAFTCGTTMAVGTILLEAMIVTRAIHHQQQQHPTVWWYASLRWVAATVGISVNFLAVAMGMRAVWLASRMKTTPSSSNRNGTVHKPPTKRVIHRKTIISFFWDVFVDPDLVEVSWTEQTGRQFVLSQSASMAVFGITMTAPGLVMSIMALNLAFAMDIPVIGPPPLHSDPVALSFTVSSLEMMGLSVLPANFFDLTMVLRKRMSPKRAAIEIVASVCSGMFGPLILSPFVLTMSQCRSFLGMMQIISLPAGFR